MMFSQLKSRDWKPPPGLMIGAANIMMIYRIDMMNIDVPASVVSFFSGFRPRLAIQQKNRNTTMVSA